MTSKRNNSKRPLINNEIKNETLIVVDQGGNNLGKVSHNHALSLAAKESLDLVIVSTGEIPVCKIMDFGRHQYNKTKKQKNKPTVVRKVKEFRLNVNISDHDFGFKINRVIEFVKAGNMVRVVIRMRGRELSHKELGLEMMERIVKMVEGVGKVHDKIENLGNQVVAKFISIQSK